MPHKTSNTKSQASKTKLAKQLLSGGGVIREDSDDELGLDDYPWEWIYSTDDSCNDEEQEIVGAHMGTFQCMVGDCVLLKAEGTHEAWIGLICDFAEDEEDGKMANFMWFSTEREIRNKQKKRTDALPVGYCPGLRKFEAKPLRRMRVPRSSKEYGKVFICRRGCNTRTATYTDLFDWENIYKGSQDIPTLIQCVQSQTKATRKRKRKDDNPEEEAVDKKKEDHIGFNAELKAQTHAAEIYDSDTQTKPLEFTPLGTRILSPNHTTSSPFQIARTTLHVSSVPPSLPCRSEEFSTVYDHLEAAISAGSGSCIYISGTPGTGKTATVREVVAQLNASVQAEELDDFIFVEINGMKVTDPHQAYSLLWEALRGERVSPTQALGLLEREFDRPSPRRVPCLVLMDELDQLVTKNQSVMYNFFNWPGLRHSRLIVLAVANTMDLPERTLSNKISSRLGLTRITFPGYTHEQLMTIIQSRLTSVPAHIVDPDAIQFASRKVAAVSGDARRALDICRRAVEIAEAEAAAAQNPLLSTPSKRRDNGDITDDIKKKKSDKVTIGTIKQAINEATSSPLQQYLKALPLAAKVFLAALLARTRRSGVSECVMSDVIEEAKRLGLMAADNLAIQEMLLTDVSSLSQEASNAKGTPSKKAKATTAMVPRTLGIGCAATELAEAGIVGVEGGSGRRGDRVGRLRLSVGEEDVRLALRDDGEVKGLGFAS
ncbi:MAG: hypothetical protein Q9195_002235 [Heterodermia aff. obscurata]